MIGGGLDCGPVRFHSQSQDFVAVSPLLLFCQMRFIKSVFHFDTISPNANLPCCLVFWSVDTDTLNQIMAIEGAC